MNTITYTRKSLLAASALAAAVLSACASNTPNASLESARFAVNQTAGTPEVVRYAPLELKAARDTIDQADSVWRNNHDAGEVNHLSYLATQRAAVDVHAACLELLGDEPELARALRDARLGPIGGGTDEVMKEILGRSLGV